MAREEADEAYAPGENRLTREFSANAAKWKVIRFITKATCLISGFSFHFLPPISISKLVPRMARTTQ
jgi:hypothetical protein